MFRRRIAIVACALLPLLAAPAAVGKEGVRALLDRPLPRDATPGSTIPIAWTLSYSEQGKRHPFGASGIFVRVSSASGGAHVKAPGSEISPGRYVAGVRVPEGGIGRISIGLEGWRYIDGRREDADVFFPVDNRLRALAVTRAAREPRTSRSTAGASAPPLWLVAAAVIAAAAAILTVGRALVA